MAQDPAATTGPVSEDKASDNAALLNRRNKYRDLQKVDMRLREAVAQGDENYVRSRLGADRILSEAEILLMIKTRQEATENTSDQLATAQAAEAAEVEEQQIEEESFTLWARRYVAERVEQARQREAASRDGYGYYANFGYDRQGNYNDSFGGRLDREGIYHHPEGMQVDIRRGVVTHGRSSYNHQTGEVIIFDEDAGHYVHMRRGADNKLEIVGTMSEQEKERLTEEWKRTNKPMSAAEYAAAEENIRTIDEQRRAERAARADTASSAEAGAHGGAPGELSSTERRSNAASSSNDSTAAPSTSHVGMAVGSVAGSVIADAYATLAQSKREREAEYQTYADTRTTEWGNQFKRKEERRRAETYGIGVQAQAAVEEEERKRLEERVSKFRAGNVPGFTLGEASRRDTTTLGTKWVKDKDGGIWDDKGGYFDTKGGYWDAQGGYLDAKGNYADQYGGYKAADGSYLDAKGNYVDPEGNLWLAGNNGNAPDFLKKDGVNYIDVLAKAAENRYGELGKGNAGLTAGEAKDLQERLTAIAQEFQLTQQKKSAGPRLDKMAAPDTTVTATPQKSSFVNNVATAVSAEVQADKETPQVSLRRPATASPRSSG